MDAVNFNLFPLEEYYIKLFEINVFDEEPETSNFEVMGYETKNSILNLGSMFAFLIIFSTSILLLLSCKFFLK